MGYRRRVPRARRGSRSLLGVYDSAVELTARMDAERQIILAIAFAHVFDVKLDRFTTAIRRHRRRVALELAQSSSATRA